MPPACRLPLSEEWALQSGHWMSPPNYVPFTLSPPWSPPVPCGRSLALSDQVFSK